MTSNPAFPKHAVIDNFLPSNDAARLLEHALKNPGSFEAATVRQYGETALDGEQRKAATTEDLGPAGPVFTAAVEAHAEHLCRAVGLAPFAIARWDVEMAVHRDGGFFAEHIDTMTAGNRMPDVGDRIISLVYYLHRPDARFSGGELILKPFFSNDESVRIAPQHNRLVAFPSVARHEVAPIEVPGDAWHDARFSINCWLLRAAQS